MTFKQKCGTIYVILEDKRRIGKMKVRIELNTMTDVTDFVSTVTAFPGQVYLSDGKHQQICAKSQLGAVLAKMEWDEIYCISDNDISGSIVKWIV